MIAFIREMCSGLAKEVVAAGLVASLSCDYRDLPSASFTVIVDPTNPKTVTFDASQSKAADKLRIVSYEWSFGDGNSKIRSEHEPSVTHPYSERGHYYVTLKVIDDDLGTRVVRPATRIGVWEDPVPYVVVGNFRPTASLAVSPQIAAVNQPITFDRSGSSDEDGTVEGWRLEFDDHEKRRFESDDPRVETTTFSYQTEGSHTPSLTVWDDEGEPSQRITGPQIEIKSTLECEVTIVAPREDRILRAPSVSIDVRITGDLAVTAVDFYIDRFGPYRETTPPFSHYWDLSQVENGSHLLEAFGLVMNSVGTLPCRASPGIAVTVDKGQ